MGTLIEPNARSAPTPACAATVSIERFRFRGGVSFGSDDVRDVALPAFRRLLLLPREVGERPAVEHRLDRLGSLPDDPGDRRRRLLAERLSPFSFLRLRRGDRPFDGLDDLGGADRFRTQGEEIAAPDPAPAHDDARVLQFQKDQLQEFLRNPVPLRQFLDLERGPLRMAGRVNKRPESVLRFFRYPHPSSGLLFYKSDCKYREYPRQARSPCFSTTMRKADSCLLTPETRCPSCFKEEITFFSASSARRTLSFPAGGIFASPIFTFTNVIGHTSFVMSSSGVIALLRSVP